MKRRVVVAAFISLIAFLSVAPLCEGFRHLTEGDIAPDFVLKDLKGKSYSLSQAKGKVVIILYCRFDQERSHNALKALKTVHQELSDQPVRIYAITKDTDKLSEIESLEKSLDLPFPLLLDGEEEVYSSFGVFVFPSTALIDKGRVYRFHYGGFRDDYSEKILLQTKVYLGLIAQDELAADKKRSAPGRSESQRRALNFINLGKTLKKRGMDEKALEEFRKGAELDPANAEGQILLGLSLLDQGKADQALTHLKEGIELDPRSTGARIGLGRAYRMLGETDRALKILQNGIELTPNSAAIHFELGMVYESLGKTSEALTHYKSSAESLLKKSSY
jgi:tetratricopeptide (TPR) repeat protein